VPFTSATDADNLQLAPQSPTSAAVPPQAMQDTAASAGTGADGPKYSALDFWAAQMRNTTWGQAPSNLSLKGAYGAPLIGNADDPALADGKIPEGYEQYANQFVGLHTPEEVAYKKAQIDQKLADQRIMGSSGYTGLIQLPLQLLDPTNIALMATPLAETRIANAVRQAVAAAGVGAAQETLNHGLDPTHVYGLESVANIGASALLGGILGAAMKPKLPAAEYERLRAALARELEAKIDENFGGPGGAGDSADKIARDLKERLAAHGDALERAAGEHAGAAEGLDPKQVEARVQAAQDALREAQAPLDPGARAAAIEAEMARLQTPDSVRARLEEQHGERLPEVLQERAAQNVDEQLEPLKAAAAKAQAALDDALADQARLERAAASRAELERFRGIQPAEPVLRGEPDAAPVEPSLRSDVPAAEGATEPRRGEPGESVPRPDAAGAAHPAERTAGRAGQPVAVREASGRGSALEGLGSIFEAHTGEGAEGAARLHLQRPLELTSEQVPKFRTVKEARAWATEQIARGHDGLVIDSSHLGGPTHYVSFHPDQVNHPSIARIKGTVSSAPAVEKRVYDQLTGLGRFDDKQARAYAAIVGDFYGTQGKRLGITADELFQRFPLRVTQEEAALQGVRESLSQKPRRSTIGTPYTLDLFGEKIPRTPERGTEPAGSTEPGGNVQPAGPLSRDDAPGRYARRTEIVKDSERQLGVDRVTTPAEAATAFHTLAKGAKERFDALVTDKDGKPLAIVGSSTGTLDAASVYPSQVAAEAFRINDAANIWFGHNHPSGFSDLSLADENINRVLADLFEGSRIKPRGILAVGGGAKTEGRPWEHVTHEGDRSTGVTSPVERPTSVPVVERQFTEHGALGPAVRDSNDARKAAAAIAGNESGLVLLDNRHTPVGFVPVQDADIAKLRDTGKLDEMHRVLSVSNANRVVVANNGTLREASIKNLAKYIRSMDGRVLDVIDTKTGASWRDQGIDADVGGKFKQESRGTYDPHLNEISLLPTADVSTFLHEAGHHFLNVMGQLASQDGAPLSIREDFDHLMRWFGIHNDLMGAEAWTGMSVNEQRPYHEQFATAFEQYLKEGRAPSTRLQSIFQKFRSWLTEAYRSLSVFNPHTPGVRDVMDRMLADETEIRAARQERISAADTPLQKRLAADEELRDSLRSMAERETGWAEVGGQMIRKEVNGGRGNESEISRTSWIGNSDWWAERPGGGPNGDRSLSEEAVKAAVDKALAGEKLGSLQQRTVQFMIDVHDERIANEPFLPTDQDMMTDGVHATSARDAAHTAMVARLSAIDEDLVQQLAIRHGEDDAGFMDAVRSALHANDEDARAARSIPQGIEPFGIGPDRRSAAGPDGQADAAGRLNQAAREPAERVRGTAGDEPDLLGERTGSAQRLSDETRRRDTKRNTGQESLETGDPGDLFSEARRQGDLFHQSARTLRDNLADQLARLPPEDRAHFEARIAALEHAQTPRTPLYAAPADSVAGATTRDVRADDLKANTYATHAGAMLGRLTGWFAPGSRALRSPFLTMRRATQILLETPEILAKNLPTEANPHGVPTRVSVEAKLKRYEGNWYTAWNLRDQLYRQYRNRPLGDLERNQGRMDKHAFNEAVSAAMRRGDIHETPEVEQAAQMTRKMVFDPLKVEAQKLGLLPAQEDLLGGTAQSYLMRQYDWAKINANPREWHEILVDHFMHHDGLEAAEASDVAHRVTMNIKGSELGLLDTNERAFDRIGDSGRVKERQLLLPDEKLEKFLVNDIDTLTHAYTKSLAPQVEIMKAFPGDDRNLKQLALDLTDEYKILKQRALVANDNAAADKLDQRLNRDMRDLVAMRDRLYGRFGAASDPSHWAVRAGRAIRSLNGFRMLGTATFSHLPDIANVVMRRGLGGTMATAARMLGSSDARRLSIDNVHRVGAALDMIHNSTAAQLGEFGIESSYGYQKALNRGMRAFTIATLETPLIATTKAWSGTAAHDEILAAAERVLRAKDLDVQRRGSLDLSKSEITRFNAMGIGYMDLQRIGEQFREYGNTVNGIRLGQTDRWHDRGAAQLVDTATAMAADAATLHPSAGDTPLWTSSEIGKAIFQFKSFGAVAIRKILIPIAQGLALGDARAYMGLATLIGAGTLTYLTKQAISGQPVEKEPSRFALEVLDKSNLLGWTGEFFYPALWAMGANNFSRWGDRQTWETLGGPVAGTAADVWDLRLPAKIKGQMMHDTDPKQRFSRGDLHRIRRLLPANQVWYLRRGVNALEGQIGDSMGLPPEAPRGNTQ
jgi:hypothetical protein